MKSFSVLLQFILGFFVGILLLVSGTTALAYVVFYRLNTSPPKPIFVEETPKKSEKTSKIKSKTQQKTKKSEEKSQEKIAAQQPQASPGIEEEKKEKEEKKEDLPSGAYKASVIWPSGLSLRAEPDQDAQRIGGIDYEAELIILKTSLDGDWQNVRLSQNGQEGWVKAGNVQKIE
jgi:outer membrane biosynthesis protein TonB